MRKVICLLVAMLICVSMVLPVIAAENEFVPSISYKDGPEIVPVEDDGGEPAQGIVRDENGEIIDYFYDCLEITTIPEAKAGHTAISEEARLLLLRVYEELRVGTMKLPQEDLLIRELVDVSWLCGNMPEEYNHPLIVEPEGIVFEVIFDLGVSAKTDVYVMTYKDEEWNPIVKTVNNGDGTVTCTFEKLCPVVFAVDADANADSGEQDSVPDTGDAISQKLILWSGLLLVSAVAMVSMIAVSRKKKQ